MDRPSAPSILELAGGMIVSQALFAVVQHRIPDAMAKGPRSANDLAAELGLKEDKVHRTLRFLAQFGLFESQPDHLFKITDKGAQLTEGHPSGMRNVVITAAGPMSWGGWAHFSDVMVTGRPGIDLAFGTGLFGYLAEHPWENEAYNGTMEAFGPMFVAQVANAWDFSQCEEVVDVGGGRGHLLAAILETHPRVKGILFDLEQVIDESREFIASKGLDAMVTVASGSFFEEVPQGADAYVLAHVLHDWDDEEAASILRACHRAMRPEARLLIAEAVLPEGDDFHPAKQMDVIMMINTPGKERTLDDWQQLLARSGFELVDVHVAGLDSLIEAVPGPSR